MICSRICPVAMVSIGLMTATMASAQAPAAATIYRGSTATPGVALNPKTPTPETRPTSGATAKPTTPTSSTPAKTPQQAGAATAQKSDVTREAASKPTEGPKVSAWTQQNPSGIQNRQPVEGWNGAPRATNNYFGQQFRDWQGMSAPVGVERMPAAYFTPPQATQSNVMLAPNTWYGPQGASWSNVRTGTAVSDPRGGYSYRVEP